MLYNAKYNHIRREDQGIDSYQRYMNFKLDILRAFYVNITRHYCVKNKGVLDLNKDLKEILSYMPSYFKGKFRMAIQTPIHHMEVQVPPQLNEEISDDDTDDEF